MNIAKKTITIGISAYNEEKNIRYLLEKIKKQKLTSAEISEVIIVSDGSEDGTVNEVKKANLSSLTLIESKNRAGVNRRLNEILNLAKSDILIFLNADVDLVGDSVIEKLTAPILSDERIGLVGGDVIAADPKTIFERVVAISHALKMEMGKKFKKGNNVYMCYGGNRALSKKFYRTLNFPDGYPDDAFSYLSCIKKGLKFYFEENAKVKIRLPKKFADHARQSVRFSAGKRKLEKFFGKRLIAEEYTIPSEIVSEMMKRFLVSYPISTISYLILTLFLRLKARNANFSTKWTIAKSTKSIL